MSSREQDHSIYIDKLSKWKLLLVERPYSLAKSILPESKPFGENNDVREEINTAINDALKYGAQSLTVEASLEQPTFKSSEESLADLPITLHRKVKDDSERYLCGQSSGFTMLTK